jgi:hypothetical protein
MMTMTMEKTMRMEEKKKEEKKKKKRGVPSGGPGSERQKCVCVSGRRRPGDKNGRHPSPTCGGSSSSPPASPTGVGIGVV